MKGLETMLCFCVKSNGLNIQTSHTQRYKDSCLIQKHMKKKQVGKDQEKALSEKDSHSKNRGG